MSLGTNDSFRDKIRDMLVNGGSSGVVKDFKSKVFAEVQSYSKELQEAEHVSDFFFRLCELILDCQSLSEPDDSFRIIVASLLCESKESKGCLEEEVRQLIGMDAARYETAMENFKNRQCIASVLNRKKTGRKSSIMAGKRNFERTEQRYILRTSGQRTIDNRSRKLEYNRFLPASGR